jgi:hypothetical protein
MNADPLITTLIDLYDAMARSDFKLILGGGFGLYLKQLHLQRQIGLRTLLPGELWPLPRATEDLDVFLPTEVVVSLADMQALRAALDQLGFKPVEEAKFLHFVKPWGTGGRVKIDMLTGPIDTASATKVQILPPRVRPRGKVELHAYLTEEALDFELSLLPLTVEGIGSDGKAGQAIVFIPQPFTFLLMKLHAFADRAENADSDLGRHHALDVYRIVAMLTEEEYALVRLGVENHTTSDPVHRAREIIAKYFSSPTAMGMIRMASALIRHGYSRFFRHAFQTWVATEASCFVSNLSNLWVEQPGTG